MKVKFLPQDTEFEVKSGQSVLEVAQENNIYIKSVCGGIPSCAECRVKIVEGNNNVLPPNFKEKSLIGTTYFVDNSRLSCQIKCMGNITVDISEQVEKENQPTSGGRRARTQHRYRKKGES